MKWKYITKQGDTWDVLALDIYGSEKLMNTLIQANPAYCDIIVFDAGITLIIPETPKSTVNQMVPPWERK